MEQIQTQSNWQTQTPKIFTKLCLQTVVPTKLTWSTGWDKVQLNWWKRKPSGSIACTSSTLGYRQHKVILWDCNIRNRSDVKKVVFFSSFEIVHCSLFTFENRISFIRYGESVVWHLSLPLINSFNNYFPVHSFASWGLSFFSEYDSSRNTRATGQHVQKVIFVGQLIPRVNSSKFKKIGFTSVVGNFDGFITIACYIWKW